jgi:hypothetical protein
MACFLTEQSSALAERRMTDTQLPPFDVSTPSLYPTNPTDELMSAGSSIPQNPSTTGSLAVETKHHVKAMTECKETSRLLEEQEVSSEATVSNALSWLLDDNYNV